MLARPRVAAVAARAASSSAGSPGAPCRVSGREQLKEARLTKGLSFTLEERQLLGIHGLLPPRVKSQAEAAEHSLRNLRRFKHPLNQYIYCADLLERNERLFYKLLSENTEELMPIVYTPTVGEACQKFGLVFKKPVGLFVTVEDQGHVLEVVSNWPESGVRSVVVTDGERVLGLGDLGAHGMGIAVGKLAMSTAIAGIPPALCLPVTLDVGTNNRELREDRDYMGLRRERVTGAQYEALLDEFMEAVVARYGQDTLVQFEDFANYNAFRLLERYKNRYCVFNDDIQGTASVVLAGLLAGLKALGSGLQDQVFLFQGAGEAALGIAELLVVAMVQLEGVAEQEARSRIWLRDILGLVVAGRPAGGITEQMRPFAHPHPAVEGLEEAVRILRPSVLLGASAVPGAFTPGIIEHMASYTARPVIMALSNPTDRAECTAEAAYRHSGGRALFAGGSPSPACRAAGRSLEPAQANNAYIFPGLSLAVISAGQARPSHQLLQVHYTEPGRG